MCTLNAPYVHPKYTAPHAQAQKQKEAQEQAAKEKAEKEKQVQEKDDKEKQVPLLYSLYTPYVDPKYTSHPRHLSAKKTSTRIKSARKTRRTSARKRFVGCNHPTAAPT